MAPLIPILNALFIIRNYEKLACFRPRVFLWQPATPIWACVLYEN